MIVDELFDAFVKDLDAKGPPPLQEAVRVGKKIGKKHCRPYWGAVRHEESKGITFICSVFYGLINRQLL